MNAGKNKSETNNFGILSILEKEDENKERKITSKNEIERASERAAHTLMRDASIHNTKTTYAHTYKNT